MTINNKKVALSERLRPDVECAPWVIVEVRKMESAYAELAAELEREKMISANRFLLVTIVEKKQQAAESQLAEERELRMSLESSWQQAEAQLAELRGKVEGLADKWWVQQSQIGQGPAGNKARRKCADELRSTLAAADGG